MYSLMTELQKKIECYVLTFLLEHNCPTTKGNSYLKHCVTSICEDELYANVICDLYQEVADIFGTSLKNVERCIRTLVTKWWSTGLQKTGLFKGKEKPTNRQCILTIVKHINKELNSEVSVNIYPAPDLKPDEFKHISIYEKLFS